MIKKTGLLVLLVGLTAALAPLACGGGGGGSPATDFCAKYATATCMRTFACPDPANPFPAGFTMSTCVQAFTKLCTDKPDPNAVPTVSCYGATTVNAAAESSCLSMVAAATCDQINNGTFTYDAVCSTVCSATSSGAAGSMGAAGTNGAGGSGTGTGGTAPAPADAAAYCKQLSSVNCDQGFKCSTPADRADPSWTLGATISECKGSVTTMACATAITDCGTYNALFAQACINKYAAQTCDDIALNGLPPECMFACQ
jgi:hypothetical protein